MKLLSFYLVSALTKEKKKFKAPPQKQVQVFLHIPLINFTLISQKKKKKSQRLYVEANTYNKLVNIIQKEQTYRYKLVVTSDGEGVL